MDFYYNNKYVGTFRSFEASVNPNWGVHSGEIYYIQNGRVISSVDTVRAGPIHIVNRLPGGKGGFGSMLRAIGAQIEKTTNREACRDLSGRRLRDINEEKRLQNWIDQQAEREKEVADRKQKKLERLCERPKHEFKDDNYEKERQELPDRVESAVEQGMMEAASGSGNCSVKRKAEDDNKKKKKKKIWMEDDMSDLSTSDSEDHKAEEMPKADCSSEVATKSDTPDRKDNFHAYKEKVLEVQNVDVEKQSAVKSSC